MANYPQKNGNLVIVDKIGDSVEFTNSKHSPVIVSKKHDSNFASVLTETTREDMVVLRDWINCWLGE